MLLAAIVLALSAVASASPYAPPNRLAQPPPLGNIPTVLAQNGLTTLVDLVTKNGLAKAISGPGPFTVFAPTNDAFKALDVATQKSFQMDPNLLKKALTYHVISSGIPPAAVKTGLTPKTLSGQSLLVKVDGKDVTINGALRLKTLPASNGIIYVIDKVLIPEQERDLIQVLEGKRGFSTLLTAIKVAGLTDTLKSPGSLTLLAPTDAAFKALPDGALDALIADPEKLKKVLLNHVLKGTVCSLELPRVEDVKAIGGESIPVAVAAGGTTIGKAKVVESDLFALNGVVHILDSVLLPSEPSDTPPKSAANIPTILTENRFTTLVDLVTKAGLAGALSGPGPFTVFAPTNEAFDAVSPAILKALQMDSDLLKRVLTYHVLASSLPASGIKNDLLAKTMAGESVRVNVYGPDKVTVNGALRVNTFEASNGYIHVIDKVLVPGDDKSSIIQVLEKKGGFNTLLFALGATGLTKHFETAGPFTLFAPTDEAFRALPSGKLNDLMANSQDFKKTLLSHVLHATMYSKGLGSGGTIGLARGGKAQVTVSKDGRISLSNAEVIEADVPASNGVIHVINGVI